MLKAPLACLAEQIAAIEAAMDQIRRAVPTIANATQALRSIPGIGPATAAALIALMPELGSVRRRQAAALAGLAPHPNQSGANDAYRRTRGGRAEIKRILFLPALAATRHDPAMRSAYKALINRQKKPMAAIVAIMRRIIVIANARLRDAAKLS